MKAQPIDDRILFPGSPWPNGHAIESFLWCLELESPSQIRCHFDLESANYDAEEDSDNEDNEEEDGPNWTSKIVWNNYQACMLSSLAWDHAGFVFATPTNPLGAASLLGHTFEIDPLPVNDSPAFGIYCQGHDSVARHKVSFSNQAKDWTVDWCAKIALTYLGASEFEHDFMVRKTTLKFPNVTFPPEIAIGDAEEMLRQCVDESVVITRVDGEDGKEFQLKL